MCSPLCSLRPHVKKVAVKKKLSSPKSEEPYLRIQGANTSFRENGRGEVNSVFVALVAHVWKEDLISACRAILFVEFREQALLFEAKEAFLEDDVE